MGLSLAQRSKAARWKVDAGREKKGQLTTQPSNYDEDDEDIPDPLIDDNMSAALATYSLNRSLVYSARHPWVPQLEKIKALGSFQGTEFEFPTQQQISSL